MKNLLLTLIIFLSALLSFSQVKIDVFNVGQKNTWEVLEDAHGNIWFHPGNLQAMNANVARFDGKEFHVHGKVGKHNTLVVYSMSKDKYKNVWFSGPYSAGKFDGTNTRVFKKKDGLPSNNVAYVYCANDGATWISTGKAFPIKDGKLGKIVNDEYIPITDSPIKNNVSYIYTDSKGNMWFGCRGEGFYKYDGETWTDLSSLTDISWITYITEDQEGNIWFAALEGYFAKFDGEKLDEFRLGSAFMANTPAAIGAVPYMIIAFAKPDSESLPKIVVDDNDNVWVLIRKKGVMVNKDNVMQTLENAYGIPWGNVVDVKDIIKDSNGNIWICNYKGAVSKFDGTKWTTYTEADGIPKKLNALFEDSIGNIWVPCKDKNICRISFK